MKFETDPGDPNRTTVIFETAEELNRASQLGSLPVRILYWFGLAAESTATVPLPGAVADEKARVLPSKTETPISNKKLINAANRILKRSLSPGSLTYRYGGPNERAADPAFAFAINNHFGSADITGNMQSAGADVS